MRSSSWRATHSQAACGGAVHAGTSAVILDGLSEFKALALARSVQYQCSQLPRECLMCSTWHSCRRLAQGVYAFPGYRVAGTRRCWPSVQVRPSGGDLGCVALLSASFSVRRRVSWLARFRARKDEDGRGAQKRTLSAAIHTCAQMRTGLTISCSTLWLWLAKTPRARASRVSLRGHTRSAPVQQRQPLSA